MAQATQDAPQTQSITSMLGAEIEVGAYFDRFVGKNGARMAHVEVSDTSGSPDEFKVIGMSFSDPSHLRKLAKQIQSVAAWMEADGYAQKES